MWEFVKSHEGELSTKACVAFLTCITRSFCYGPSHGAQNVNKVIFGKGTQLHVLPSKCYSCDFLILTPIELKVVWV